MKKTTIDYDALANGLESRCGRATLFLRVHLAGRKTGIRKTHIRTVLDKLKARHVEVTRSQAHAILDLYCEIGLGTCGTRYGRPVIFWNHRINLSELAHCLETRAQCAKALRRMPTLAKGPSIVCLIPAGSHAALVATGLAQRLEIEVLAKPEAV